MNKDKSSESATDVMLILEALQLALELLSNPTNEASKTDIEQIKSAMEKVKIGDCFNGETDKQLEKRTVTNMEVISAFINHVKEETGIEIPEEPVLSFFNA